MALTGKFDFRRSWTGKIILKVEDEVERRLTFGLASPSYRRWRDAKVSDLMQPELGDLLDLKNGTFPGLRRLVVAGSQRRAQPRSEQAQTTRKEAEEEAFRIAAE